MGLVNSARVYYSQEKSQMLQLIKKKKHDFKAQNAESKWVQWDLKSENNII